MKKNPKAINGIAGYTTKLGTAPIACTVTCISKPTSFTGAHMTQQQEILNLMSSRL
jgi:hypothetical protein